MYAYGTDSVGCGKYCENTNGATENARATDRETDRGVTVYELTTAGVKVGRH